MLESPSDENDYGWVKEPFRVTTHAAFVKHLDRLEWYNKLREDYKSELLHFSTEAENNFKDILQTPEELKMKLAFRQDLEDLIIAYSEEGKLNWQFQLCVSGSSVSGLGSRNSDVDLCLCIPDARRAFPECPEDGGLAKISILQIVRHMIVLSACNGKDINVKSMALIKAGIPLLRIITKDNIEVDLSVCVGAFVSGVHNSYLIKAYTEVDPRFAPLCILVKTWASKSGVKNPLPSGGKFNSYAVTMLLIHFLQCGVVPPVLPNLQKLYPDQLALSEEKYPLQVHFNSKLPTFDEFPTNDQNIAELFIGFLIYYGDFNFSDYCISMKDSCLKNRHTNQTLNTRHTRASVYIEDPIDLHNPGRTCWDFYGAKRLFKVAAGLFEDVVSKDAKFPSVSDILQNSKPNEE